MYQNYNYNNYNNYMPKPNALPPQQILQANGKTSIDMLQMSPNSSVLIADTTAPVVWRCVSDGLGNVTSEAFDIVPHKDETEIQKENIEARLSRLEAIINESTTIRNADAESRFITDDKPNQRRKKSSSNVQPIDEE